MNIIWIKRVYLYMVSLISLIILVIAAIMLINMALKTWIFTKADEAFYYVPRPACDLPAKVSPDESSTAIMPPECTDPNWEQKEREAEAIRRTAQKQRDAAQALAMIIVASPVFLYHWRLARKET